MLVFDSSAFIALLENEAGAWEIERLLQEQRFCFVHALNAMEVFYHISRKTDVLTARRALQGWAAGGLVERTDIDPLFREDAGQLKADWRRVSLADCCGLALARRLNAEFVTADHHEMDALNTAKVCRFRFFR